MLIRDFVNTLDVETGEEGLADSASLAEWLAERDMPADEPLGEADVERARRLRESLRGLLLVNNGAPLEDDVLAELRGAAAECRLRFEIDDTGRAVAAPAGAGVDRLAAQLLAGVARAQVEGTWERLKACPDENCEWAFYDASRNRSRTWCSMEVCGNRAKTRSYRARRSGERT